MNNAIITLAMQSIIFFYHFIHIIIFFLSFKLYVCMSSTSDSSSMNKNWKWKLSWGKEGNASFMIHHHTIARSCIHFFLNEFKAARFKASIYYVSSHLFSILSVKRTAHHHSPKTGKIGKAKKDCLSLFSSQSTQPGKGISSGVDF